MPIRMKNAQNGRSGANCAAEQFSAGLELLLLCLLNSAHQRCDRAFSYFCAASEVEEVALLKTLTIHTVLSALVAR